MMKLLLLVVVIGIAVWMVTARGRKPPDPPRQGGSKPRPPQAAPVPMLACAHCGVHLPQADAVLDAAGRPFCSTAHRLAGPH